MPYQLKDCVLIATGLGWPEDSGASAIEYLANRPVHQKERE